MGPSPKHAKSSHGKSSATIQKKQSPAKSRLRFGPPKEPKMFGCCNTECNSKFYINSSGKGLQRHLKNNPECRRQHNSLLSSIGHSENYDISKFQHCSRCGKAFLNELDHSISSPECFLHITKCNTSVMAMDIDFVDGLDQQSTSNHSRTELSILGMSEVEFDEQYPHEKSCIDDEDISVCTANTHISMMDLEQASNVALIIENANYHGLGMEVDSVLREDQSELGDDQWDDIKEPDLGDTLYYPVQRVCQEMPRLNRHEKFCYELYQNTKTCSMGTYDKIRSMMLNEFPEMFCKGIDFYTRSAFLKRMSEMFETTKPEEILVTLEGVDFKLTEDEPTGRTSTRNPKKGRKKKKYVGKTKLEKVKMYAWNILQQLQEMLLNPRIMGDIKNLVVNQNNQEGNPDLWAPYRPVEGDDEVHAGEWYQNTAKRDIMDPLTQMLLPLMMYVDKTGTDVKQKYAVEPLIWCLTIFRRHLREDSTNWKPLAYFPDIEQTSAAKRAVMRGRKAMKGMGIRNYHCMMARALLGLRHLQQLSRAGKLRLFVRMGDFVRYMSIIIPIAFIIGDAKSGDTLSLRYGGHNTWRMCRACDANYEQCGDPLTRCKLLFMRDLQILFSLATNPNVPKKEREQFLDAMQKLSTHLVDGSFYGMDFGANEHGILLATPSDMMHLYELGVLCYVLAMFVNSMTPTIRMKVDDKVEQLFKGFRSSKRASFLRMNFIRGCTSISLLTAAEWPGLAYCYFLVLLTEDGIDITKKCFAENTVDLPVNDVAEINRMIFEIPTYHPTILESIPVDTLHRLSNHELCYDVDDNDEDEPDSELGSQIDGVDDEQVSQVLNNSGQSITGLTTEELSPEGAYFGRKKGSESTKAIPLNCTRLQFVDLLMTLLSFHAWYKSNYPDRISTNAERTQVVRNVRMMMLRITTFCPRAQGNGWHLQKFHELTHIVLFQFLFKSCKNFDAGSGERSLKFFVKQFAKLAQMRREVHLGSICDRVHEWILMIKVTENQATWNAQALPDAIMSNVPSEVTRDVVGNVRYIIKYDGLLHRARAKWESKSNKHSIHPIVLDWFTNYYHSNYTLRNRFTDLPEIHCWTEYEIRCDDSSTTQFRSHPNFRSEGHWYDFCIVKYIGVGNDGCNTNSDFPAKCVCFYRINGVSETMALIHSCDYMNKSSTASGQRKHVALRKKNRWTNALCERWMMETVPDPDKHRSGQIPVLTSIEASSIQDGVLAFEETSGLQESSMMKQFCWLNRDRLTEWPKLFMDVDFDVTV